MSTNEKLKLYKRLLKELGLYKMYCKEKRKNSCPTSLESAVEFYEPRYVACYTLYWSETSNPTFWGHFESSMWNVTWEKLNKHMDMYVRQIKNWKSLSEFGFW